MACVPSPHGLRSGSVPSTRKAAIRFDRHADLQFQLPEGLTRDGEYLRIAATNSHAERRGELRVITAVLAVQLPQLSDVHISRSVVIKIIVHGFVVKRRLFPVEG